jgi:apolipoprotein N-acyltransferase
MMRAGIAAALVSGVALWASSPAVGAGWLAWVALVPAASVALRPGGSRGARLAVPLAYAVYLELLLVPALPFGLADGQWGDPAAPVLVAGSPAPLVALVAIPAVGLALYLIRFGQPWGADRAPAVVAGAIAVIMPAAAWTALELARVKLDPGGLWGPLFLSQSGSAGAGLASLGGPLLVTLAIVACNYALAWALVRRRAVLALAPAGFALASLAAGPLLGPDASGSGSIAVAAIQPGYDTAEEDRPELRFFEEGTHDLAALDTIADLRPLTLAAAREGAEVIVWPEASMFVDPRGDPRIRGELRRLGAAASATVVVPYFDRGIRQSAALAVLPDGRLTDPRPKQRPMWFLGEEAAETEPRPLASGAPEVGTLLGLDDQEPAIAGELASNGAGLIASSTHDWPQLATQQRAMAAIAARATGAPVVRADWRYGSAIYDRDGQRVADAGEGLRRTAITAAVSAADPTPYARMGDVVGWVAAGISLAALLFGGPASIGGRRRSRPAQPAPAS